MAVKLKSPGDFSFSTTYTWTEFIRAKGKEYSLTKTQASNVIKRFGRRVHDLILENPDGVKFPFGTLLVAGKQGDAKDRSRSTKDRTIDYRNLKTDKIVFTIRYIYGYGRGRVYTGVLWKFRGTVPLRQRIKQMIDQGNWKHWYVFKSFQDVPLLGVPPEYVKHDKSRSNK